MKKLFWLVLVFSCKPQEFQRAKIFAGGQYVTADTLNLGKRIYTEYCMACHGVKGDGKGVASKGLNPPPRDFTLGIVKFGNVLTGELTHDQAVYQTLTHGLGGTAMLPWDLAPGQMEAVWQYIKTFAPQVWEGKDKKLGAAITPTKDPFGLARKNSAVKLGRKIYHVGANCQACHRGYVTPKEFSEMHLQMTGKSAQIDDTFYQLKPQDSEHGYKTVPPDFTFHKLRSVRQTNIEDIYVRLAAGIGGTTMPSWRETLSDEEIWALSYYVQHLMKMRDQKTRRQLIEKLGQ